MDRRDFMKRGAAAAGAAGLVGLAGCARPGDGVAGVPVKPTCAPPDPTVSQNKGDGLSSRADGDGEAGSGKVGKNRIFAKPPGDVHVALATGTDPGALVAAAVEAYGGIEALVHKGDRVVIKPNLAWGRTPETGATTSPEVLGAVIKLATGAGAAEVLVLEHSCDRSVVTFEMTGAKAVCEGLGVRLISLDSASMYREELVSLGVNIKSEHLPIDVLEADVYINLPCLKHHEATNLSMAMKNQMGAIFDPQRYHKEASELSGGPGLHQNIADLASALRPTVVIADATRALATNGPKGPGNVLKTNSVIVTHDMVTADVLGAGLMKIAVERVPYLGIAAKMGLGIADIDSVKIARV